MKPKLIALDMDGTMLDERGRLSERTKKALQDAQEEGVRVVVSTGRMYPSAMTFIREIGIESASIFYNGAVIRDARGVTIFEQDLGAGLTGEILEFFHERDWYIQIYWDDKLIVKDAADERCKYYENICGQKAVELGERFWDCGLNSTKLLGIAFEKQEYEEMIRSVRERFGGKVYQATSWGAFVEMVHPAVNKARALERLCAYYGIKRSDVMAIGDGANDAEMVRWAGTGVAMGNARPVVKEAADVLAPPNSEDGAAHVIERALSGALLRGGCEPL